MAEVVPVKRALVSVSDKSGVVDFARDLSACDVEILSTGGTAKLLSEYGISVKEVSKHTASPEAMGGRVKTLHPKIHGGILGRRDIDEAEMQQYGFDPIDLVVVNLYPFEQTISRDDCTFADAIENIDIGGPTMIRAAAKNHDWVTILVDPEDYSTVGACIKQKGGLDKEARAAYAAKAFAHTAGYDTAISDYFESIRSQGLDFPPMLNQRYQRIQTLRYGENPHQQAAFYRDKHPRAGSIAYATQQAGKELSYNNIADTDAALECVKQFDEGPACVIVKHANPCGAALGSDIQQAYDRAYLTDPESAFGGIIAFNQRLDAKTTQIILDRQFVEVIIAPGCDQDVLDVLTAKKNVRLLTCDDWHNADGMYLDFKRVSGGLLAQTADIDLYDSLEVVTETQVDDSMMKDLLFAWRIAKYVKSNAIVYAKEQMTIGVGAGQMSRVNSARIAAIKAEHAGLSVSGSVMASDAFFPFRDAIDTAANEGIAAIIQPGGSMRDDEVIAACNEHGIGMVFTGMRHFRH